MLDLSRTRQFFEPEWLRGREVNLVGGGAVGSRIAEELGPIGVPSFNLYDPDVFDGSNVSNQRMLHSCLGKPKATSSAELLRAMIGEDVVVPHIERVSGKKEFSGFVFTAVDHMDDRSDMWKNSFRGNENISLLVDTRIGADGGKIIALNPSNIEHIHQYEKTELHTQAAAEAEGCGRDHRVGATASIAAAHAVWRFQRWLHFEQGEEMQYENIIYFEMRPQYRSWSVSWL